MLTISTAEIGLRHPPDVKIVIGVAIGFGLAAVFRFPIATAIAIPIPIAKMLFKPL